MQFLLSITPPPATMASKLGFTINSSRFITAPIRRPSAGLTLFGSYRLPASKMQSIQLIGRDFTSRRRLIMISPRATTDQPGQLKEEEEEVVDSNIIPYCSLDKQKKKTIGEMEQDFLQALQAFYYEGKAIMSNEEFDNLKEELMWEGSSVVMLSSDEQKFLEASMAYVSGNPIMSDEEFDKLKNQLKKDGSDIVAEGPRCSLRSRKVYSDLTVDYLKMFLINVPAAVVALGLFFFLDDITGFEITYLLELPEPFSFIFVWFAAIPFILYLSFTLTNVIVRDFLILKTPFAAHAYNVYMCGPSRAKSIMSRGSHWKQPLYSYGVEGVCPNCGTENNSFFGTILTISSGGAINNVKCSNCQTTLLFDKDTRLITLPEGSEA